MKIRTVHFPEIQSGTRPVRDARAFLETRFPDSVLLLADLSAPLSQWTELRIIGGDSPTGVAALFRGFAHLVVTIVSDALETTEALWTSIAGDTEASPTLIISSAQSPPPKVRAVGRDYHMMRDLSERAVPEPKQLEANLLRLAGADTVVLSDCELLTELYASEGVEYWNAAMVQFGHYRGVLLGDRLVASAGVDFVLPDQAYGHIGNVVTRQEFRRLGLARACIRDTISSLQRSGIHRCGLFVDASAPLLGFYHSLGFRVSGVFNFFQPENSHGN